MTSPAFGVLNYEIQHKEGICKVSGGSVMFSAFYADFYLCSKAAIITTLTGTDIYKSIFFPWAKRVWSALTNSLISASECEFVVVVVLRPQ